MLSPDTARGWIYGSSEALDRTGPLDPLERSTFVMNLNGRTQVDDARKHIIINYKAAYD